MTTRVIGLSGSLRRGSFNTALLRAAAGLMPAAAELVVTTLHGIPLYDGDLEAAQGVPAPAAALKDAVAAANGLLLVSPEYNHSIPGVLKNAIDWMSRPADDSDRVFARKPVAVIGASSGGFGTLNSQNAWLPVLRTLGTRPWWDDELLVARAPRAFDPQGVLTDAAVRDHLQKFLAGFVAFVRAQRPA